MKTRNEVNIEARDAFRQAGGRASILNGTGTGKSKLAIDIVKEYNPSSILLLTSSERSRDISWEFEFKKFGAEDLWLRVVPECYQTVYKWEGRHFPFVIADEVDFAITKEYVKSLTNNTYDRILCLSGFVAAEKREALNEIAPICYTYPTQQAQEDGILNRTKFLLVEFDLSFDKTVEISTRNGGRFYQSENASYTYWEDRIQKLTIAHDSLLADLSNIDRLTRLDKGSVEMIDQRIEVNEELEKVGKKLNWSIYKRTNILHTLQSSREVTKELVRTILSTDARNKIVVFSALTSQIDKICKYTYHSKNKKNNDNIGKLNRGEIHLLGVCDAINRAENLAGVNYLIKESYVGSETDFQQQHGRGMRLNPDDTMYFIILLPYYMGSVEIGSQTMDIRKPTQAVRWFNRMTKSFDTSNSRVIKMTRDYKLPEGEKLHD